MIDGVSIPEPAVIFLLGTALVLILRVVSRRIGKADQALEGSDAPVLKATAFVDVDQANLAPVKELRALVTSHSLGDNSRVDELVRHARHSPTRQAGVVLDGQELSSIAVDQGEKAQAASR